MGAPTRASCMLTSTGHPPAGSSGCAVRVSVPERPAAQHSNVWAHPSPTPPPPTVRARPRRRRAVPPRQGCQPRARDAGDSGACFAGGGRAGGANVPRCRVVQAPSSRGANAPAPSRCECTRVVAVCIRLHHHGMQTPARSRCECIRALDPRRGVSLLLLPPCFMLHASCYMLHVSCFVLRALCCFMLRASYFLLCAAPRASCFVLRLMHRASCSSPPSTHPPPHSPPPTPPPHPRSSTSRTRCAT